MKAPEIAYDRFNIIPLLEHGKFYRDTSDMVLLEVYTGVPI